VTEKEPESPTMVIIIAVAVVAIVVVLGIVGICLYKRKQLSKRSVVRKKAGQQTTPTAEGIFDIIIKV
jgi:hypothetical protein